MVEEVVFLVDHMTVLVLVVVCWVDHMIVLAWVVVVVYLVDYILAEVLYSGVHMSVQVLAEV